jgi:hypothetical protein
MRLPDIILSRIGARYCPSICGHSAQMRCDDSAFGRSNRLVVDIEDSMEDRLRASGASPSAT